MLNQKTIFLFLIALMGWVSLSTEVRASQEFSCAIIGSKKNSIKLADGSIRNPPLHLVDCAGVQLLEDQLTVCAVGNTNEKKCQNIQKNSKLSAELINASKKSKLSDTVIAMLRGDVRTAAAQTRNSSPYPGLPYGEVVGASGQIFYDFPDDEINKVNRFTVLKLGSQQKVIADLLKVNSYGVIKLDPADSSVPYTWELTTVDGRKIKGTFTYLGEMVEAIDQRIFLINSQKDLGEAPKWYLKAELYAEYGLQFDFDVAMRRLKRELFQDGIDKEK
jgi:hypothetical protein